MDLNLLLRRPEGKTLEFKRDLSSPAGVLRTLVAFANTAGGILLIGVEDGTRHVKGLDQPLDVEERLTNLIHDAIQPLLLPEIDVLPWRRSHVLAVQIHPSPSRPHQIVREGAKGIYVRIGSTNRHADPQLIEELRRMSRGTGYDEQECPEFSSEDLDFRAASECYSPYRRLTRGDLETLRLVVAHQGRKVPTVGGVLLFGNVRDAAFPDAWIQAGRFAGTDRTRIVDQLDIHQHLPLAIEAAEAFIRKHDTVGARIDGLVRHNEPGLPPVAVREALVNAVAHADYSQHGAPIRVSFFDDRLEIENPGMLPFGLTLEDLDHGVSRLRNRVIGRVLHDLGLMEQWGSGIQRMRRACMDAGLAEPQIEEVGMRFRVTLRPGRQTEPQLDDGDRRILGYLESGKGQTTSELAVLMGLSTRTTRGRVLKLIQRGLVHEIGSGPNDPRRRYVLTQP